MSDDGKMGFNTKTGALEIKFRDVNYELDFNDASGAFDHIYRDGTNSVGLNVKNIGGNFENISVDFTTMIMANNGVSATAAMDTGNIEDPTLGTGRKLGILTGVSVSQNGQIYGAYDNGTTRLLAQVAVAQFANASGLEALGNNLYAQTLNSGTFNGIGVEITADGGKMVTGQLEMSNVDLSREFTEMITTQRGFQANSRIITVSDTMLEELTNLKR
ncbi:MAG: flagellar hook protein FlgE, partial [Lachnospiraceae bacterium]|nr:flagellar hook protein FlgE [Lachnospiraceae bacterium]